MKPLSPINFIRSNKKKLITSLISILTAVAFIYLLQTYVRSIYVSMFQLNVSSYDTDMRMFKVDDKKPITKDIIMRVREDENIEKAVPFILLSTRFTIPGSISEAPVYSLRFEDMDYVMKKHNIKLLEGRLPEDRTQEIALDTKIARNKKVKIGDKIGTEIDNTDYLPGEYNVVGILDSEDYISLAPYISSKAVKSTDDSGLLQTAMLVFPREGRVNEVDKLLNTFAKEDVNVITLSSAQKIFEENIQVMNIIDVICILAIIVMVIATVSSKYVQFFNRRQELGILNAIGYTKFEIMKNTLLEVLMINAAGYVLGIGFGVFISVILTKIVFISSGGIGVILYYKAFLMTLFIPLFTMLFTLVPVNRMITRIDPITMIEGVN